jgi:hypothetical protein
MSNGIDGGTPHGLEPRATSRCVKALVT